MKGIIDDNISEHDLHEAIRKRVKEMLEEQPELLMSYLYRLDIEEKRIKNVINTSVDTVEGLAMLILERQKQRIATKAKYSQGPIEGWDW